MKVLAVAVGKEVAIRIIKAVPPSLSRKEAARPVPNVHQQAVPNTVSGGSRIVVINIVVINAFAGTGKTATLELVTRQMKASDNLRVHYLVFNQKNAREARRRMPDNTTVTTAHELAWRVPHPDTGKPMQQVFSGVCSSAYPRIRDWLADRNQQDVTAINATMTRFCHSAGPSIEREYLPPPILTRGRTEEIDACFRLARDAFEHLRGARGVPVSHDVYLKLPVPTGAASRCGDDR